MTTNADERRHEARTGGKSMNQHDRDSAELRRLCQERDTLRAEVDRLTAENEAHEPLWAVHAKGPDDLFAAFSEEDAQKHADSLSSLPVPEGLKVDAVVIPSPWPPTEHWRYLAEQERDHAEGLQERLQLSLESHRKTFSQLEQAKREIAQLKGVGK